MGRLSKSSSERAELSLSAHQSVSDNNKWREMLRVFAEDMKSVSRDCCGIILALKLEHTRDLELLAKRLEHLIYFGSDTDWERDVYF